LRFAGDGRSDRRDDYEAQPGRARAEPDHALNGLEKEIENAPWNWAAPKVISKAKKHVKVAVD
jgi:hypothetical protein